MTAKPKKTKRKPRRRTPLVIDRIFAGVEDDLVFLADEKAGAESRWNRPRKQRISLRVDTEVVDWLKTKGPGLPDADQPNPAKSDDGREETGGREVIDRKGGTA